VQAVERSQHVSLAPDKFGDLPQSDRALADASSAHAPASNARLAESTARFTSSGVVS
jgi:hypothetical protein